ncbi:MAG TPA: amidohydrolase family protein [Xanthobacteraceae bacterium]|nr:amidohydrolase family protein [Xanthobacteraceae bacterium]
MTRALPVSLPPDPNTRAPHWSVPAGACDTHAHLFGPPDIFPYAENRRYTPPAAPIEHYRNMQRITGLSRVVFVTPTAHGYDNRVILDGIAKLGDSARGIANIDASFDASSLQAMAEAGMRGARFHLMKDRPGSVEHLSEHLPVLLKLGWILDLHVDPAEFVEHETFIRSLPTPTIIDHMARVRGQDGLDQPAFRILLDLLEDDRFWVKLCSFDKITSVPKAHVEGSLPYMDMVPFAQAVIQAAPDRVIWGTDWPHGNTFTPGRTPNEGDLLDLLAVIAPDDSLRKRILVDNPAHLFGF